MVGWLFLVGRKTNGKFLVHNIWLTRWTSTSKFGSFLLRLDFLSWGLSSRTFLSWGLNVDLIIWMQGLVCAPGSLSLALPSALTQRSLDITLKHSTELMPLLCYILCFFKKTFHFLWIAWDEKLNSGQLPFPLGARGVILLCSCFYRWKNPTKPWVTAAASVLLSHVRGQTGYLTFKMPGKRAHGTL